jgi:hypothetical protein
VHQLVVFLPKECFDPDAGVEERVIGMWSK